MGELPEGGYFAGTEPGFCPAICCIFRFGHVVGICSTFALGHCVGIGSSLALGEGPVNEGEAGKLLRVIIRCVFRFTHGTWKS